MRILLRSALALLICAAAATARADGPDELWDTTMSMQSEGVSMPPMNQQICKKKGASETDRIPLDKDCKVLESKRSGSKTTFSFACDGKDGKYTGTGEFEDLGKNAHRGRMKAAGVRQGEKFDMAMEFSSKLAGSCTWEDGSKKAKEMIAQQQQMMAKECDKQIAELQPMMFFGGQGLPPEALVCKDRKGDFCANFGKVAQKMRDPKGFTEINGKYSHWPEAAKACGTDPASVSGPVCKSAADGKDWGFLGSNCRSETVALRKAHCDGKTYDTVEKAWADMCSQTGGLAYTAEGADAAKAKPQPAAKPQAEPSAADKLKDGAGKLKKFLKF